MIDRIALVDLDGTLTDYDAALTRDLNSIRGLYEEELKTSHDLKSAQFKSRIKLIRSQPNWWVNLAPLKYGFDIIEVLKKYKFDLHILTKAPHDIDSAWTEKVLWCRKYLPEADITITEKKGMVYGKILVDDWPPYALDWLKYRPRGLVIMVEHRWNKDFSHPQVIKYNGSNLDEIEASIIKLIERHEVGLAGVR